MPVDKQQTAMLLIVFILISGCAVEKPVKQTFSVNEFWLNAYYGRTIDGGIYHGNYTDSIIIHQ